MRAMIVTKACDVAAPGTWTIDARDAPYSPTPPFAAVARTKYRTGLMSYVFPAGVEF